MNFGPCPKCEWPLGYITLFDGEEVVFCFDCQTIFEPLESLELLED